MRAALPLLAAAALSCGCAGKTGSAPAAPSLDPGLDLGDPDLTLGEPVEVENLVVWPVLRIADAPRPLAAPARYLPLDDALRAGDARVLEKGEVDELVIVNDGELPVLCLSGEVLEGGQQDRIVAEDVVIQPGETAPLASFCVERGRWHTEAGDASGGRAFRSAELLVAGDVKAAAQLTSDQGQVWAGVARVQQANAVRSDTETYVALRDSEEVQARVEERASRVLAALRRVEGAVGLVAAVDLGEESEFVTGEIFGDAALCAAYRDKLVRAFALDSLSGGGNPARVPAEQTLGGLGYSGQALLESDTFSLGSLALSAAARPSATAGGIARPRPGIEVVLIGESTIEAASSGLEHVHRTLYKRRAPSGEDE